MKTKRIYPRWILVIVWMSLIFILSHQDASQSSQLSGGLLSAIIAFLTKIFRELNVNPEILHFLIRKGAHFSAYLILGLLTAYAMEAKSRKEWIFTLLICIAYASSDEYHQTFIPGRSGEIRDVLIDSSGSFAGITAYRILQNLSQRRRNISPLIKA